MAHFIKSTLDHEQIFKGGYLTLQPGKWVRILAHDLNEPSITHAFSVGRLEHYEGDEKPEDDLDVDAILAAEVDLTPAIDGSLSEEQISAMKAKQRAEAAEAAEKAKQEAAERAAAAKAAKEEKLAAAKAKIKASEKSEDTDSKE